jgi:hypothetical protein
MIGLTEKEKVAIKESFICFEHGFSDHAIGFSYYPTNWGKKEMDIVAIGWSFSKRGGHRDTMEAELT